LLGKVKNPRELAEDIRNNEQSSKGIYFTLDGEAYIVGIIDTLTDFK